MHTQTKVECAPTWHELLIGFCVLMSEIERLNASLDAESVVLHYRVDKKREKKKSSNSFRLLIEKRKIYSGVQSVVAK